MASTPQPTLIVDDELRLRPWCHDDLAAVIDAFTTTDIAHWHTRTIDTDEGAKAWIDGCNDAWLAERSATWAIVPDPARRIAGRVTMYADLDAGRGEIAYWVLPHARRRGIATRACIAATSWAHALGLHRVELEHSVTNDASALVAQRAGFVREGIRRQAVLHADGWHDMVIYSHLAGERFHPPSGPSPTPTV